MEMFSNLTFTKKLLLSVMSVVLISTVVSISLVSSNSYNSAEESSKKYINALANKYSLESEQDLEKALVLVDALSNVVKGVYENNTYHKDLIIKLAKDMLSKAPFAVGMAVDLDPNILYQNDSYLAGKKGHDKDGRFAPYVYKSGSEILLDGLTTVSEGREWVDVPRKTKKDHVTEPYTYNVGGKDVLMVTVSSPIITKDGKFLGATTIDISLDNLVKYIGKIKVFNTGYGFLLSDQGTIVGHPDKKFLSKKLTELNNYKNANNIVKAIKENKTYDYEEKSPTTGNISYYHIVPFEIGNSHVNWALGLSMPENEYLADANYLQLFSIIAGIISFIVIIIVIFFATKNLSKNLNLITAGLDSFFKYLNKENKHSNKIAINSKDEFGQMATMINENVNRTQLLIEHDYAVIEDVKRVVEEVKNGSLRQRITNSTSNQSLEELKIIFNEMLEVISSNISDDLNKIKEALEKFQQLNFTHRIDNPKGDTAVGFNALADIINEMLVENKSNGLTLEDSANLLLTNVGTLSQASNEAAASLEETAAAIEEITANISHNNENVVKMAENANVLKESANEGGSLATQTTSAMENINEQVTSINDAISVIDQIAFQTNILSLNAAVEAATAGEAGKGFAVVAQEVRNLASRSAEAAKEIKELVENATIKANDGKTIADKMILGYDNLNENVTKTLELIGDISNASKEQQTGISQINDAVNMLDKQTQQNASVANETKEIAQQTQTIADNIVKDANEKEFIGKNSVKGKSISYNNTSIKDTKQPSSTPKKPEPIVSVQKKKETQESKYTLKKVESNNNITASDSGDDEWESF
jgi:methyl-accepting chemotaxis protein